MFKTLHGEEERGSHWTFCYFLTLAISVVPRLNCPWEDLSLAAPSVLPSPFPYKTKIILAESVKKKLWHMNNVG